MKFEDLVDTSLIGCEEQGVSFGTGKDVLSLIGASKVGDLGVTCSVWMHFPDVAVAGTKGWLAVGVIDPGVGISAGMGVPARLKGGCDQVDHLSSVAGLASVQVPLQERSRTHLGAASQDFGDIVGSPGKG